MGNLCSQRRRLVRIAAVVAMSKKGNLSENNDARNVGPGEWLTALMASDLPSIEKVYAVMVASCADADGFVLIDADGLPVPFSPDLDPR